MAIKSAIIINLLLSFSIYCSAQSAYICENKIMRLTQEASLYSADVDWKNLENKFIEISKGKKDTKSLLPALQYLINTLGDKHATIRSTKNSEVLVSYTGPNDSTDSRKPSYINKVINDVDAKFSCSDYAYREGSYGHLNIVGIAGNASVDEEARVIQDCIFHLKSTGINKWVIDLRNNGGGNMNPMIAGITPFFEDGFIGGAVDANDDIVHRYEIKGGNFYDNNNLVYKAKNPIRNCTADSVVVLTSKYTISSGEVAAVALKGRPNTIFIGEETAGYTTGNGYQLITEDLALIISETYFIDRNLTKYTKPIEVDIAIPFVENTHHMQDKQVFKAMRWLLH